MQIYEKSVTARILYEFRAQKFPVFARPCQYMKRMAAPVFLVEVPVVGISEGFHEVMWTFCPYTYVSVIGHDGVS